MQDVLKAAIGMHQAGQFGEALPLYQKVLAREPANADALHLLGVLHHQKGDNTRAVEMIGRAVAIRPNVARSTPIWPRLIAHWASWIEPSAVARRLSAWLRIIPKP